ncbi:MAG: hypothetical protein HN657_05020 [Candidatus Marinimicrobia bacterium]|jgi:hypothetical protein|nr:hypothetical protein [Candidatus Neomarinimicrobiota bacterium]MBT3731467.1 hypothetical protein [Candidatus Neomarinimicrobiota bacterium]MBT4178335.1 hypothetical protein [Candidatus Neomarinimicrobiota bacterium]MBT4991384.1 hypothetical protein [Candidatus Neomarinimicrobiota bacterium]MBT5356326.1 hypothetical protein [Candidatus Neomarinimicrobiota bacterium]
MIQTLINGGPFMMILLILLSAILFISVKNLKEPFYTNSIILLGILTAFFGIFSTWIGMNSAFESMNGLVNIAPSILLNGVKTALITTFTGGGILLISTAIWVYFIKKHNLLVV